MFPYGGTHAVFFLSLVKIVAAIRLFANARAIIESIVRGWRGSSGKREKIRGDHDGMRSFKKIFLVGIWIVLLAIIISPFFYVSINKYIYEQRVTDYLLKEKGYKAEEIKSVKGVWGVKLPSFYAVVVFADEPYVEYVYFAHNKILQFEYRITGEGKQKGITQSDLKHYDPIEK
jgi:hypothetical protein